LFNPEKQGMTTLPTNALAWVPSEFSHLAIQITFGLILITRCAFSATTLTGFHFAVTALVGLVSNATGYSASKHVPMWELLWFSIVANMSITGMNLSLMLNSVGFYQVWNTNSFLQEFLFLTE
jgi:hypothetical protein